jgi:purine-binding chemotaxis protein CheW
MNVKHNDKFLTFQLDTEIYGIPILDVKEIIGMIDITHIPKMPGYVKGVVNLRGKIIPVIDLRLKFGLEQREYDDRTCIIVVEMKTAGNKLSGFIVDRVSEVLDIVQENMEDIPEYSSDINEEFLKGLGKVKDKVIMILDSNMLASESEKVSVELESRV